MMRFKDGGFFPADNWTNERIRLKGYKSGDLTAHNIKKHRKYWHHKKVHKFCVLLSRNVDEFKNIDAHNILKRIQLEADIYCEHIMLKMPQFGPVEYRQAVSISFDSLDQGEFEDLFKQLCDYVAEKYWPDMNKEQVERMADMAD